jgi:hypothetical protein
MMRREFLEKVAVSLAAAVQRSIHQEMVDRNLKWPEARRIVAREAGVLPGSLENLCRGRLKHVDRIAGKLNEFLIAKIEKRIRSLEQELAVAKAMGITPKVDLDRAEAAIQTAREALGK